MGTFAEYESVGIAPGWLQGPRGRALLEARGAAKDLLLAECKDAVKARMPGIAPADALPVLGRERLLDRGPGESDDSYRARLLGAWDLWKYAGTAYGLLAAFWYAGYRPSSGNVIIQSQSGLQYQLREDFDPSIYAPEQAVVITDVSPVHLGGLPEELWSDIAVIFSSPLPLAWVPTPPADNSSEVESIRRTIRTWKPAHCRCVVLKAVGGELWDTPVETWDGDATETWDSGVIEANWTPPA